MRFGILYRRMLQNSVLQRRFISSCNVSFVPTHLSFFVFKWFDQTCWVQMVVTWCYWQEGPTSIKSPGPFKIFQDPSNISRLSRSARRLCSDAATQEIQTKIGPGFHCLPKICHVWQKDFVKSWVSTIERHGLIQSFPETKFMAIRPFILVHMYRSPWNHWTISSLVHKQTAHLTLSEGRSLMARRMALATCPSWFVMKL